MKNTPTNEPIQTYAPGTAERDAIARELARQRDLTVEIPLIIGGREIRTGTTAPVRCPHDHECRPGIYHLARAEHVLMAAEASRTAWNTWSRRSATERAGVFLKAAELVSGKYRYILNAATMLGQSKNIQQAEIDSAAELADFLRFNAWYMHQINEMQPAVTSPEIINTFDPRPLEGFVLAITPFNFTAIAGNLPTAPAIMGNVSLWKPASTAVLSGYYIMKILEEAGLPPGVINFLPGSGREIGNAALSHRDFSGVHFTGSTAVFNGIWKTIADNLSRGIYKSYPRIVGETGGKNFIFAAPDADVRALSVALFRGAFEYQGQKCSAASRAYIPRSLWPEVKNNLIQMTAEAKTGDVSDLDTFMGAVIDRSAFESITGYIRRARETASSRVIAGGESDPSRGWFIQPTVIETDDPVGETMKEEIFGPVLTVFPYEEKRIDETLALADSTSPYALTGAVFSGDRRFIEKASNALRHAAGNFYINDKPTGAVVGQQPFGGARMSGTNDKSGSPLNLLRWVSARTIKENLNPPADWRYPHQKGK